MRDVKAAPPGFSQCPTCGSADLQRSHVRFYEKPRKMLTAARPYRCGSCQHRVWGHFPAASPPSAVDISLSPDATTPLDLSELDRALERR